MYSNSALLCFVALLIAASIQGCGDNINTQPPQNWFLPPQNIKALSISESSIRIDWEASASAADTSFAGYVISWSSGSDTVVGSVFSYILSGLSPGEVAVNIRSQKSNGELSDPAIIRWAPAARFDTPIVLTEYYLPSPDRPAGLDAGGQINNPRSFPMNVGNPDAVQRVDVYLFGGEGEIEQPLTLRSASLFLGSWNSSLFSSVSHPFTSLNYALNKFPDLTSFTEDAVELQDNRIYYVRVTGDQGSVNYARLHVRIVPGGGLRNRSVEVRISLQRSPGVPYATAIPIGIEESPTRA